MGIIYNEKSREFHLYNNKISYIINVLRNNQIGQLYFGKRIIHRESFEHLLEMKQRPMTSYLYEGDYNFSLEYIKQEYPSYGTTDYRYPAFEIEQKNGSRISNFEFETYRIYSGKPKLEGLPATYTENDNEAETLEITLVDKLINLKMILIYSVFESESAIARSVRFENNGSEDCFINCAMSMSLEFPDCDYEMLQLSGAWGRERFPKYRKLEMGVMSVGSIRGNSSHNHNPFIALKRQNTDEFQGEAIGLSLIYSGNFIASIEVNTHEITRVMTGINPHNFKWNLKKNEKFQTPEAVVVYTDEGLNGMSTTFHNLYRKRLARGYWRDKARPIIINNWEGTYFNFTEEKLLTMAKCAKEDGIELFVLDDGWFGKRNDDFCGLGDWFVNKDKLPDGIIGLSKKIEDMGLKFGLWFEPEMVNKNSILFEKHPDWIIETPQRSTSHGRNQFVLDFSKNEVVECIYDMMSEILSSAKISYVKWDMNRSITECYSKFLDSSQQGEVFHRYILGVYSLYEKLINTFPNILFESCASGGGRFDAGMLYYAPQCWTSDDTDAIERLKIQYGTSYAYPLSSMAAHVSAVPNAQVYRNTPIETRANVAYFGEFGYELDITKLSKEEHEIIKKQTEFYKKYRELFMKGNFYRLLSPFESNIAAWMVVSEDKKQAIVGYYKILNDVNSPFRRLKLKGLDKSLLYKINELSKSYGDELMNCGIITSDASSGEISVDGEHCQDYYSKLYILEAE